MKGMLQGEYCLTPGCVKAATALINNMDPSVDPCVGMLHVFCMAIYKDLTFEIVHWYSYTGRHHKKIHNYSHATQKVQYKNICFTFKICFLKVHTFFKIL
jgi:hypothetical protein